LAVPIAGDPMADLTELAQLFDADVDDLARHGPLVVWYGLGGLECRQAMRPSRFRTRLTVAAETPTSAAICAPVWRCLRKASTAAQTAGAVWRSLR
jgi:hypothetical protein